MHAQKQHFDCLSSAHKDSHFNESKLSCMRSLCCGNSYCFCFFLLTAIKSFYLFLWPQIMFLTLFGFAYLFSCLVYFIHTFVHSLIYSIVYLNWLNLNLLHFFTSTVSLYAIIFFFFHFVRTTNRKKSKFTFNAFYLSLSCSLLSIGICSHFESCMMSWELNQVCNVYCKMTVISMDVVIVFGTSIVASFDSYACVCL